MLKQVGIIVVLGLLVWVVGTQTNLFKTSTTDVIDSTRENEKTQQTETSVDEKEELEKEKKLLDNKK